MAHDDDSDLVRSADLQAARNTIGSTKRERLAWVVTFVSQDSKKWHSTERAKYGDCLLALGHTVRPVPPLPPRMIDALHRELRVFLRDAVGMKPGEESVPVPSKGFSVGIVRATQVGKKPAIWGSVYHHVHAYPRTAIFQAVRDLILEAGDRLLACPVCGMPFLAIGRRKFCGRVCTNKATWAAYPASRKRKARKKWYGKNGWRFGARRKGARSHGKKR